MEYKFKPFNFKGENRFYFKRCFSCGKEGEFDKHTGLCKDCHEVEVYKKVICHHCGKERNIGDMYVLQSYMDDVQPKKYFCDDSECYYHWYWNKYREKKGKV